MATTLANLHVLDGDEQQISKLLPNATVGRWSENFVSIYSQDFSNPGPALEKTAKSISRKLSQPVLLAWIFDADDIGFHVYQKGKRIVEHITMTHAGDYIKAGNIPLFCEILQLPVEDEKRIRFIWKKADAEEKLILTASLLGLPLYNDSEFLPEKPCLRDSGVVDKWIFERPKPPKIKNQTKAVLVSEEESVQMPGIPFGVTELPDGGFVYLINVQKEIDDGMMTYVRCAKDSSELWRKNVKRGEFSNIFGVSDTEIILNCEVDYLAKMDSLTGDIGEKFLPPFSRTWSRSYHNGFWWITADVFFDESGKRISKGNLLIKCNNSFQIINEIPLTSYTQGLYFSPNGEYIYIIIYKEQVMVVDTETLEVVNVLNDKSSCRIPNGFDSSGRFWFQCDYSTAEAWDMQLTKTFSRHRLKGYIFKWWKDEQEHMCAATYEDKSMSTGFIVNRVYRFE